MTKKLDQIEADAVEFGRHLHQGGYRMGLLCARSVGEGYGKISAIAFAELSHTKVPRVTRYLKAWKRAAESGIVPKAEDLVPGEELDGLEADDLPDWSNFYDAQADKTPSLDAAYAAEAAKAGTTPGMVARAAQSQGALIAAIKANPEIAKVAQKALTELADEKIAEFAAKQGCTYPQPKPEIDAAYIDVGGGVLGEAITALDVEIEKMERADWVKALLRVSKALERNVNKGVKRFGYTTVPEEVTQIKQIQAILSETAFQFSDGFIGADVPGEVK